jgi:hypothetical protein
MKTHATLLLLLSTFFQGITYAQCVDPGTGTNSCDHTDSKIILASPANLELVFDSFSEYNGGITLNGSSIVRLKVLRKYPLTTDSCKWMLSMYVSNGGNGTPVSQWETLTNYGIAGSGIIPTLDLLQVKIDNGCNTPINSGMWQNFDSLSGAVIHIINNSAFTAAGTCGGQQVNGAGSYLTNYNEYSFVIDYRIKPGMLYRPGHYELSIKYCLTEM